MHTCCPLCFCDEMSPRIDCAAHFWPVCPAQGTAHRNSALRELMLCKGQGVDFKVS